METVSRDAAVVVLSAVGCCCLTAEAGRHLDTGPDSDCSTPVTHVSGEHCVHFVDDIFS